MKKIGFILTATLALMASCSTSQDTVKMTIASEKRLAMGVAPMEVLVIKEGDAKEWSLFYSSIEGFTHENGYEYVLDVKKENRQTPVPADVSSVIYKLVKEVSKTQKTSENMPAGIPQPPKYVWTAKVIGLEDADVGVGAAKGKFPVKFVKLEVLVLNAAGMPFKEGAVIHAELVAEPRVMPELGKEYIFKAKDAHPAHALGIYMLDTDVQDLIR